MVLKSQKSKVKSQNYKLKVKSQKIKSQKAKGKITRQKSKVIVIPVFICYSRFSLSSFLIFSVVILILPFVIPILPSVIPASFCHPRSLLSFPRKRESQTVIYGPSGQAGG